MNGIIGRFILNYFWHYIPCTGKHSILRFQGMIIKTSQVRTDALNSLILWVSMFLSNEGASKVLALLGVTVSNDTIQRLYDRIVFVDDPDIEEVGIDDVAIRRGQTYATAIYDLKDHHLIALLEGREVDNLKEWLKKHKKIKLVTRD